MNMNQVASLKPELAAVSPIPFQPALTAKSIPTDAPSTTTTLKPAGTHSASVSLQMLTIKYAID